ncbi:MAG: hypothetical protein R3B51_07230 [Thermodesulfobacteriota bacterium]
MVLRTLIVILAVFVSAAGSAFAQIKLPDVTGPTIQRIPVFVPDLSSVGSPDANGQEFVEVLRNDLLNAALFRSDVRKRRIGRPGEHKLPVDL